MKPQQAVTQNSKRQWPPSKREAARKHLLNMLLRILQNGGVSDVLADW